MLDWLYMPLMHTLCQHLWGGLREASMRVSVLIPRKIGLLRISGQSLVIFPNGDVGLIRHTLLSVVLEWLKKKREEDVEKGWKDGEPGA